ncbi:uncharacterized protein EV420DRAFT_1751785 [Desarmillaria tabescens]|uniref:Uncharacterized protein n=1 Tax=Armillaria tabescens TaxID=1929756 RepID=A0AA39MRQ7_ARMTA|nr:uncharacterized protein EV420DRAFT_1751785 [Desarmillaria tabescens]KAK0444646.1 hypothetical protein EV420DRAFT_1751785 [Desarmillaria tabescens]
MNVAHWALKGFPKPDPVVPPTLTKIGNMGDEGWDTVGESCNGRLNLPPTHSGADCDLSRRRGNARMSFFEQEAEGGGYHPEVESRHPFLKRANERPEYEGLSVRVAQKEMGDGGDRCSSGGDASTSWNDGWREVLEIGGGGEYVIRLVAWVRSRHVYRQAKDEVEAEEGWDREWGMDGDALAWLLLNSARIIGACSTDKSRNEYTCKRSTCRGVRA